VGGNERPERRGAVRRTGMDFMTAWIEIGIGRNAVEDPAGLHLAAPRLAGSAAHSVAPGAHQQRRRRTRRPQTPSHAFMALSDQRSDQSKRRAPCMEAAIVHLLVHAVRRQLSAYQACTCHHRRRCRVRAVPIASNAAPAGIGKWRAGQTDLMRVRHQHRSIHGALRGAVPLEGVGRDSAAARTQGKAFPSKNVIEKWRKYGAASTINLGSWRTRQDSNLWPTPSEGVTLSS
jgi:hypothetical protein